MKINIKLINILLISLITLTIYKLYPIWEVVEQKIINPLLPFFISFIIAYFLYPLKCFFKKKFNNIISTIIIITIVLSLITFITYILIPLIYKESTFLINTSIYIIKNISVKYNIDLSIFTKKIIEKIDITASYNTFINTFVTIFLSFYLLIDMEKIRNHISKYLKNKKYYIIIKESDTKIKIYLKSILTISIITFFEYLILYSLIKHEDALLLALLASILNIIPYFGGIIFGLIALLTAHTQKMIIKTIIIIIVCTIIDCYIINPISFKKSNDINPIISIVSLMLLSSIFGIIGIILNVPILIIIKEFIKNKEST